MLESEPRRTRHSLSARGLVDLDPSQLDTALLDSSAAPRFHAGEQTESPTDDLRPAATSPTSALEQVVIVDPRRAPSPHHQLTPRPTALPDENPYVSVLGPPSPPLSESGHLPPVPVKLEPGLALASSSLALELVKPLGTGSFSSVWLARDVDGQLGALTSAAPFSRPCAVCASGAPTTGCRRRASRPVDTSRRG